MVMAIVVHGSGKSIETSYVYKSKSKDLPLVNSSEKEAHIYQSVLIGSIN
jgi:hypothetical protein